MDPVLFTLILPHTKPVMPFVSLIQHAKITMPDKKSKEVMDKLLLLNNSIFLKAEFAKQAFRIIKQGYTKFAEEIDDGYLIKPEVLVPAWREIDVLIFDGRDVRHQTSLSLTRSPVIGYRQETRNAA